MSDEEIMSAFLRLLKMFVGSLSNIPPSLKYICSVISQKVFLSFVFLHPSPFELFFLVRLKHFMG